jgi:outer membrane protein assembly factor BamB
MSHQIVGIVKRAGMERRQFLKRAALAGTGLALSMQGGFGRSRVGTARTAANQHYPAGVPWVTMRGNRQNTGISPLVGFTYTPRKGTAPFLSYADTNPDGLSLINATPIIGPGDIVYIGSSNNHFYSFSPQATNNPVTPVSFAPGNIVDSAGCFLNPTTIFFPCGDFSLWECNATDISQKPVPHKMQNDDGSPSTIHWFEGNVVADVNNLLYAGNDDFCLYCCDPAPDKNKYPLWLFPTGFFIWTACSFSPDNTTLYFASADMTVYALDITSSTPNLAWSFEVPNMCTSSIAVDSNNVIYFGCFSGDVFALNGNTGEQIWEQSTGRLIYASPALGPDGVLYIIAADGVLRALDTATGAVNWEFFTGMPSFSSAALGPDPEPGGTYLIYIGTGNGKVLAMDPKTGLRRWSFDIATLYNVPAGQDPAFSPAFRYPAINSSLAIGTKGIATATSGGLILWIDYDYYNNSPTPAGIVTQPSDDYIEYLDQPSLCYISPAGRMAQNVLPTESIEVYPAQTISLTYLEKIAYGTNPNLKRSTFKQLPQNVQVAADGVTVPSRVSANGTQIYIEPLAKQVPSRTFAVTGDDLSVQFDVTYQGVTAPLPQSSLPSLTLEIDQVSFFSPFIVPALDQLGLATISVPFKIVNFINSSTGTLWAYGYESYSLGKAGNGAMSPPRNLIYVFTGTYQNGNLVMASTPSYFELTSFPSPLTTMKMSGVLEQGPTENSPPQLTGLSLQVEYTETTGSLINWLCQLLTHWLVPSPDEGVVCDILDGASQGRQNAAQLAQEKGLDLDIWLQVVIFLVRIGADFQRILGEWHLFNSESQFTWAGTYSLGVNTQPVLPPLQGEPIFSNTGSTLNVTIQFTEAITDQTLVVGIVIIDSGGTPLNLNYTDRSGLTTISGATVTQQISLKDLTTNGCTAAAFVNLDQVATYQFPN